MRATSMMVNWKREISKMQNDFQELRLVVCCLDSLEM